MKVQLSSNKTNTYPYPLKKKKKIQKKNHYSNNQPTTASSYVSSFLFLFLGRTQEGKEMLHCGLESVLEVRLFIKGDLEQYS